VRILIIDDEPSVADLFSRLAAIHGFTDIDIVSTSEEAVTHVLRARYDLITLDIRMPGASGLEIIAILHNMNPHAVIAVISGHLHCHCQLTDERTVPRYPASPRQRSARRPSHGDDRR
jgi:CheY-like chemotaxis protein